jgi:hypothetical protein
MGIFRELRVVPRGCGVVFLKSAPVAQLDRANASGALGREFESLRAHQIPSTHQPMILRM